MKKTTIIAVLFISWRLFSQEDPFPLIDLHVHIKADFTMEKALQKSRAEHIQYGIAINCGLGFPVHSDRQVDSFLLEMKKYPEFFVGMQAEGREWV